MGFDRLVEQKIREAMAEGQFDGLEGAGRPIDLEAYFATPEELRAGFAVMKNAGVVPEEMQLLKEIDALRLELESCLDEASRARLEKSLHDKALNFRLLMEGRRRK
jgi:hypothetical protein